MSDSIITIGSVIKAFRLANDYTITKLSDLSCISKSYICSLEHGNRGTNVQDETLYTLEEALNIPHNSIYKLYNKSKYNNFNFQQTLHEALHVILKL